MTSNDVAPASRAPEQSAMNDEPYAVMSIDLALPSSERVYRSLRDGIIDGQLLPGQRLVEVELAQRFASSRTPVREALKRLGMEGLVSNDPVRGMVVRELDAGEAEEIYVIREAIDGLAGRLAAQRITEDDIMKLDLLIERQRECIGAGDWRELQRANRHYHEVIYRSTRNAHLADVAGNLHDQVRTFSLRCFASEERGGLVVDEHLSIARALSAHDAAAAEETSKLHIANARAHHARLGVARHTHAAETGS